MKKRILSSLLALILVAGILTASILTAAADVVIQDMPKSNHNIKELVYYDKNPDPNASQYGVEDYPAVWMHYDDPDGHDNAEIFALKEVASQEEAKNEKFGMDGFRINGKWYKVIGLWTVNPQSDVIDKGNGEKAVFTPLYYTDGDKPQKGETIQVAIYDYDFVDVATGKKGGISNLVDVKIPGEGETTEVEVKPADCEHANKETQAEVVNVDGSVTIDGQKTNVALVKETEVCPDCQKKKTTKVHRLRFKSRSQMMRYLSGKYAKLRNGRTVHFKGDVQKIEKVFWNKKYIKISKAYNKRKGSVILDFTDEFLSTVADGSHELMVLNGDEFTAMNVTVQDHQLVVPGAYDLGSNPAVSVDDYNALMQECEENEIEVVDCDLDAFYAGGFMINADDNEVTMNLSADTVPFTGKAITPPAVTLTSDMGVEYAQGQDFTLAYYHMVTNADGEVTEELEVDPENIYKPGNYTVVATPTRNGVLSGEASASFAVVEPAEKLLGDVDYDGEVTIFDATWIQRELADLEIPCVIDPKLADADGDGDMTILDATFIQRWLADLPSNDAIGKPVQEEPVQRGYDINGAELKYMGIEIVGKTPNLFLIFANSTDEDITIDFSKFSVRMGDGIYLTNSGERVIRKNTTYAQFAITLTDEHGDFQEGNKAEIYYDGTFLEEVTVTVF